MTENQRLGTFGYITTMLFVVMWLGCAPAWAQNVTCATRPVGDSSNACASTAFVQTAVPAAIIHGTPTAGQLTNWYDSAHIQGIATGSGVVTALGINVNTSGGFITSPIVVTASNVSYAAIAANASASTVQSRFAHLIFPEADYGLLCDGATDETAKWNKIFTDYPGGAFLLLPAGTCVYSNLTVPDFYTFMGRNKGATCLATNSASADGLTVGNAAQISDVCLTSTVTRTGGNFVKTAANEVVLQHIQCRNYFICFSAIGVNSSTLSVHPTVRDLQAFNPVVGAGTGLFVFDNFSSVALDNIIASGAAVGQQPDFGVRFLNGDTAIVSNLNITKHGFALDVNPSTGKNALALYIENSFFDSAGVVSGALNAASCYIAPTGTGTVQGMVLSNVWCGLASGNDGLLINPDPTALVDRLHVVNGQFDGNGGSGVHIASASVTNWSFEGGGAAGNTLQGFHIAGATTHGSIIGFKGRPNAIRGPNAQYGLKIDAVAADYIDALWDDWQGNTVGDVSNGATGTHNRIITINGPGGQVLDAIAGFSSTGIMRRTGAGAYSFGTTVSVAEGGTGLTAGTSGGIPYFASGSSIASSALLAQNYIMIGGGVGAAPSTASGCSIVSGVTISCTSSAAYNPQPLNTNTANDSSSSVQVYAKSRSGGNSLSGDDILSLLGQGYANGAYQSAARIYIFQAGASSGAAIPSTLELQTGNTSGALNQKFRFDSAAHSSITQAGTTTVGSCGGGTPTVTGNDTYGEVLTGNTATTSCVITFATAYASAPICGGGPVGAANSGFFISAPTTTTLTLNYTSATSAKFSYWCRGS